MDPQNPHDRVVPFSSKLAFGVGQFAEGLKNTGFNLFILFYYNQVLELPGVLAGAALFVALLFDAVTAPPPVPCRQVDVAPGAPPPVQITPPASASGSPSSVSLAAEGLRQWGLFACSRRSRSVPGG